jgi:hypothetical protein
MVGGLSRELMVGMQFRTTSRARTTSVSSARYVKPFNLGNVAVMYIDDPSRLRSFKQALGKEPAVRSVISRT